MHLAYMEPQTVEPEIDLNDVAEVVISDITMTIYPSEGKETKSGHTNKPRTGSRTKKV